MNNIQLVKRKFERSAGTYDAHAHAQKQAVCKLFKIIAQTFTWQPEQILEIGCGTGLLTKQINTQYYPKQYFLNDINERVKDILPQLMPYKEYEFLYGDAQQIVLPKGNDLVVSASSVQWFDDLPKFFEKIKQSMTVDGYMFFSTFGPSNLQEITALENQGLHYYTLQELKQILQTQFELITCDEECIKLSFEDPLAVLKHLKYTGVNGGFSTVWNKTKLKNFCRAYTEQFSEEKGVTLTYHPIYFAVKNK